MRPSRSITKEIHQRRHKACKKSDPLSISRQSRQGSINKAKFPNAHKYLDDGRVEREAGERIFGAHSSPRTLAGSPVMLAALLGRHNLAPSALTLALHLASGSVGTTPQHECVIPHLSSLYYTYFYKSSNQVRPEQGSKHDGDLWCT
ncbi:hypothetical protein M5K25_015381 [Dendrobium thyrsiflorum]|uniref:Uncharacterized protein n=1 Tax=Dendrobium thyrsiflorum TaxID=117978 RepID=A0ABD0UQM5_DENTH